MEDELDDLKVCKVGSVILVDNGASFTSVNNYLELKSLWKGTGTG